MSGLALVTGGAGFIGGHLVAQLRAAGQAVRVLDPAAPELPEATDLEVQRGSILDPEALSRALRGVRHVYHLAALAGLFQPDPARYQQVNVEGTRRVLAAATAAKVERVVLTSSETVFADPRAQGPLDEGMRPSPDRLPGPYSRSKAAAVELALAAAAAGSPVVVVHVTTPLGPGDRAGTPPTRLIRDLLAGRIKAIVDCRLNVVAVQDVARGHLLAAEHGRPGRDYILGSENLMLSALVSRIATMGGCAEPRRRVPYALAFAAATVMEGWARRRGQEPLASREGVRLTRCDLHFDCRRAIEELGWQPQPVAAALEEAVAEARTGVLS